MSRQGSGSSSPSSQHPNSHGRNDDTAQRTPICCLTLSKNGCVSLWKPLPSEVFDRNIRWI